MFSYLVLGATFAFAAAVQPGPFQTYLVSQALSNGWRRTLPAALAPLVSDGPVIVVVLLVLRRVPIWLEPVLRLAGGAFLLYLAGTAFKAWKENRPTSPAVGDLSARRSLGRAAIVNLLSPGAYLGWSLVLGPLLLKGWREAPSHGIALVVGFYATMVITLAGLIGLFAGTRSLGSRVGRGLLAASVIALFAMGLFQIGSGATVLLNGVHS